MWVELTGCVAQIHMRTDTNNLVTTTKTTHLPDHEETVHMINMLCHEAQSGNIDGLAHVVSVDCVADCLTSCSASADNLAKAVFAATLPNIDSHPPFRDLLKPSQRAYLGAWLCLHQSDKHIGRSDLLW